MKKTVLQCSSCGTNLLVTDPDAPEHQNPHHVFPDVPASDWICYGTLVAIDPGTILDTAESLAIADAIVKDVYVVKPAASFVDDRAQQEAERKAENSASAVAGSEVKT